MWWLIASRTSILSYCIQEYLIIFQRIQNYESSVNIYIKKLWIIKGWKSSLDWNICRRNWGLLMVSIFKKIHTKFSSTLHNCGFRHFFRFSWARISNTSFSKLAKKSLSASKFWLINAPVSLQYILPWRIMEMPPCSI